MKNTIGTLETQETQGDWSTTEMPLSVIATRNN